jgi:uncharacterized protein (TIGR00369 family)
MAKPRVTATKLDQIRARLRESAPLLPIAEHLGFHITAVKPGRVTIELDVRPHHANAIGTLHGGVLCDIADAAMALSHATNIAADETFTTLELKINFLKPVWKGKLRAEGKVIKQGRTIGLTECDVFDDKESLVAHATSTCMTLRGDKAKGR